MATLAKQAAKPFLLSLVIVAIASFAGGIYADSLGIDAAPDYRDMRWFK
jgi:hypothetical protein